MEFKNSDGNKTKPSEKLTVDAIHPLFNAYRNQKNGSELPEDENRYFCKECHVYLPMVDTAVAEHFQNRTHFPIESCIYCEGPVCEYFLKYQRQYYHNCVEKNETESQPKVPRKSRLKHYCGIS